MILYYIRHGEPIYNPDSLTEYGQEQARALVGRMTRLGLDKIYTSTSNRAIMTARPTCEALGIEPEPLDFANEGHAWRELGNEVYGKLRIRTWAFCDPEFRRRFNEPEVLALGKRWYDSSLFDNTTLKQGILRIQSGVDELMASLGYVHDNERNCYRNERAPGQGPDRVAIFAHQGFGLAFLSCLTDVPYPLFCTRFDLSHSSVTAIEFSDDPVVYPRILQLSNDSHLYKEGILRKYNNAIDV